MAQIEHVPEDDVPVVIYWIIERTLFTTIQPKSFLWFLYFDFLFLGASGAVWITSMVHRACVILPVFLLKWTVMLSLEGHMDRWISTFKVQRWFGDLIWSPEHRVVLVTHEIIRKLRSIHRSHFAFLCPALLLKKNKRKHVFFKN